MPSCGQLALMRLNIDEINNFLTKIDGELISRNARYWSSTEYDSYDVWTVSFSTYSTNVGTLEKLHGYRARLVRTFA
jgi:hypothetical protein